MTERLRRHFPGCGLTADLIQASWETEAEHRETLAFLERCAFSQVHVFPYSRRRGLPPPDAGPAERGGRRRGRARGAVRRGRTRAEYLRSCVGRTLEVLFETESGGLSTGHASNYVEVSVRGQGCAGLSKRANFRGLGRNACWSCYLTRAVRKDYFI